MQTGGSRHPFAFRESSSDPEIPLHATIDSIENISPHLAYHVTSEPMTWPCPPGIRHQFRYKQLGPTWRTPPFDPFQHGSGYIIAGVQPGLDITAVKWLPIVTEWHTTTGGNLLQYEHPVPYTAP